MNFEDTIHGCMQKYPRLFIDRWEVLNYLFCTLHCDHKWVNGELTGKIQTSYHQAAPLYGEQIIELNKFREKLWGQTYYFYPLGRRYSHLFNFPQDIKESWLKGILETIEFILVHTEPTDDVYIDVTKEELIDYLVHIEGKLL